MHERIYESTGLVRIEWRKNVMEKEERVSLEALGSNPAEVSIEAGITLNMGNYESAKVTVSLKRPCVNTKEGVDKAHEEIKIWVMQKIDEARDELRNKR